jgi:hypothetical protein
MDKEGVMVGTMMLVLGTVFITFAGVIMFLRALFHTVEQFEHHSFLDEEWMDWMENELK